MKISDNTLSDVLRLNREQCVKLLESFGFVCYVSESVADLREAICSNLEDGTLQPSDIALR